MPRTLHTYTVVPSLPERLSALRSLAYNLRWSWDFASRDLFRELAGDSLWEDVGHNPARLLGRISQERLAEVAADTSFTDKLDRVANDLAEYLASPTWWSENFASSFPERFKIAYFSAEFGLTESLPIYSGGLGVLAGDHLKAASDLGLPLVGVGFLYQRGYFRQALNADGWQMELYPVTDFHALPIELVTGDDGLPRTIAVAFPGRTVRVQLWKAQVGRVTLYLMDTNLPENAEPDRYIAGNLYGGDNETRIQQEIVLGIGGIDALSAVGITPAVCHMNEGHSAFMSLERIRRLMAQSGMGFEDAASAAAAGNLFTTHTPVPAGFDIFPAELMYRYFSDYAGGLGLTFDQLLERGRHPKGEPDRFNMAVLAFRHARYINGVSKLHGHVSRQMAASVWDQFPLEEVPVGSVTNGIHTETFVAPEIKALLDKHGAWDDWSKVDSIPDADLWSVHQDRRRQLVEWARAYQERKCVARGASDREVDEAAHILDPNTLTIGFARRFATYKRGDLFLRDVEHIKRLINDSARPIQFVFAGKAHPRDEAGKELIRRIVHFTRDPAVRGKVVFLEDYDMAMARMMVQGVDIWLNNPRRPMEASGTSGMKVVPNGGLNFSVLDGWWAEAYEPSVGWSIGRADDYDDLAYQDLVESNDLYQTLEDEIIPLFYDRDASGLPIGWVAQMKSSMKKLAPVYATNRMVREYAETYYVPAARHAAGLADADFARTRALVQWKRRLRAHWQDVRIESVTSGAERLKVGESAAVAATVRLGSGITPDDVCVELYAGPIDVDRNLISADRYPLTPEGQIGDGQWRYTGALPSHLAGRLGFSVRIQPCHPDAILPQELPLIAWEQG